MVQGINKDYIFLDDKMKKKYKTLLCENMQKSNAKLLSYCIMSNHAHMLMYTNNFQEISKLMQKINTSFARIYNRKNNRVGFVFKDRFSVQQIRNRQHLYNCLAYIHFNPIKAGIVRKLQDYEYSSYREWITHREIIDENANELVFDDDEIDINEFHKIYLRKNIIDVEDIDESIDYKIIIEKYEKNKGDTIEKIIQNDEILRDVVIELKKESKLSLRRISEILKINRPKITNIIKENVLK